MTRLSTASLAYRAVAKGNGDALSYLHTLPRDSRGFRIQPSGPSISPQQYGALLNYLDCHEIRLFRVATWTGSHGLQFERWEGEDIGPDGRRKPVCVSLPEGTRH